MTPATARSRTARLRLATEARTLAATPPETASRERARRKAILAKVGRYVDLKLPVIPGFVSVNASAIWADATGALD